MFKKCLENRITRIDQDYKCHLCNFVVKQSRFDAVEEHLKTDKHKEQLNKINNERRKKESELLREFSEQERKKIVENLVIFDKKPLFWNCFVCKCKISGLLNILPHVNGAFHKKEWVSYIEQNKKVNKIPCDKPILVKDKAANLKDVVVSVHQLQSNNIIHNTNTNSYYCNICKIRIIATPNISQHTQGLLHQALVSKLKKSQSSSKTDFIIYDEKSNSYNCTICNSKIDSTPNVTEHIQGFSHQTLLKVMNEKKMKIVDNKSQEFQAQKVFNSQKNTETNKVDSQNQDRLLEKIDHKFQFTEICYCHPCQYFIRNSLVLKCHVLLHLYEESESLQNLDLIRFKLKPNDKVELKCYLCNIFVCKTDILYADQELEKHLKTNVHLGRLLLFKYNKNDISISTMSGQINSGNITYKPNKNISLELLCNICDVPVFIKNKQQHASGKHHRTKLLTAAINSKNAVNKTEFDSKGNLCFYNCFICDESYPTIDILLQHYITPEHKWKIKSLEMINTCSYMKFTKKIKLEVIECSDCKITMHDFKTAINHMEGKRHNEELKLPTSYLKNQKNVKDGSLDCIIGELQKVQVTTKNQARTLGNNADFAKNQKMSVIKLDSSQKIKKVKKFEASEEELRQLGFSTESIQIPKLNLDENNSTLDNLISLDFEHSQARRLPSLAKVKSHRTPKVEGQRNSFATNVLLNGKQYIKFCIDSGPENMYNFDHDKMNILKLGVSLTFPYQSNRACIPCGQQFPVDVQSLFEHLQKQEHLDNINEMQVEDTKFYLEDCSEQFSDLRLAKLYMHVLDQGIHCNACNIQIGDEDEIIRKHAKDLVHKEKSKLWQEESEQLFNQYFTIYKDIWYYAEVFFCEVCKKRCEFEMDFVKHLINPEHMKKVYEHKFKRVDLTYDLCPSCITYWYGKTNSYEMHCKSNFHKRFVKNKDFMVPNLTITASEFLDNIDENVELLENESNKIKEKEESNKETALLKTIIETVKPVYPNAEAYIFGSRLSYLGFPSSDVDVFLDCENVYYSSSTQEQSQQCINSVRSYFESTPNIWVVDEVLLATRVPIMKLRHITTNLKCDISFINGLSVEKSKLVGLYNVAFPTCRKLILFMKKWLTLCRLFGSDCITTFAISWFAIFYLQLQGILPTVYELIDRKKQSKIVDEPITAESSSVSFKKHLKGFFTYFANFDYQKDVICPYLGKTIDKHAFAYSDELPIEMDIYKTRLKNNEVEIFRFDSPLCIQDPIDLSQNITKAVKKQQLRCFRRYCILSAEKC